MGVLLGLCNSEDSFHVSCVPGEQSRGREAYGPSSHINDEQLDGVGIGVKQG